MVETVSQSTVPFVHLRVHSAYSLSQGALRLNEIVSFCEAQRMQAIAVTDTNNMFGALEFSLACEKARIKPIVGLELRVSLDKALENPSASYASMVLLAENEKGYKNLLRLISSVYDDSPARGAPYARLSELEAHKEGLIFLSGGSEGPFGQLVLQNKHKKAASLFQQCATLFPNRFFMEIMRHGEEAELKTEDFFLEEAYRLNIPLVATNNAFFLEPDLYEAHDALLCIEQGTYVAEEKRKKVTPHHYLKTEQDMKTLFADLPEALENTYYISELCQFHPTASKPLLPCFSSDSERSESEELIHQAKIGLEKRFQQDPKNLGDLAVQETYKCQLEKELEIIIKMGFSGYFLIVADFIQWAKKQEIPVGPGRGSGAGCLVAWSLTITDLDPIRFGLFFERFLNPERVSMPDFDVDFCQDRRDEVIAYVQKKYGKEKVAQIITFGKLQARAVLRDVGRVLQIPYPQVDKICKLVPNNPAHPCTLEEALAQEPLLREMMAQEATVDRMMGIARKLEGLYRHASTHAAGLIIGDRPLCELVPLYRDSRSDILATQFSMKYSELAGLVKFDFLGLKTLSVLRHAVERLAQQGIKVDLSDLPLEDEKTFQLLNRMETVGIFQLEGQGMREVIGRLKIDKFEEIIALGALYRPGPMDDIPRYIACKHGEQAVHYAHPSLEPILKETYGVIVYQEQAMQIAQVLAGYSMGGADLLRRAMGKKIKSEMDAQRKVFIDGAISKGVDGAIATEIFEQIAKFASYGFPKAHAAPYALIAYQTAYMKANYPHEFMCALMTADQHNTDKLAVYKQELQAMGIGLLPPDVNFSEDSFCVETDRSTGEKFVRYGLAALKNVGVSAMQALVSVRQNGGVFRSLEDFLKRLTTKNLNKRQLESLIASGALDSLSQNRQQLFASAEYLLKYAGLYAEQGESSAQTTLFGAEKSFEEKLTLTQISEWPILEKLKHESEAIGFYFSTHPLKAYEEDYARLNLLKSTDLATFKGSYAQMAGMPLSLKERVSKTGKKFGFLSLSDEKGSFEMVVFSENLPIVKELIAEERPVVVSVSIKQDVRGQRVSLNQVTAFDQFLQKKESTVIVTLENTDSLKEMHSFFEGKKSGKTKVFLNMQTEGRTVRIALSRTFQLSSIDLKSLRALRGVVMQEKLSD